MFDVRSKELTTAIRSHYHDCRSAGHIGENTEKFEIQFMSSWDLEMQLGSKEIFINSLCLWERKSFVTSCDTICVSFWEILKYAMFEWSWNTFSLWDLETHSMF